MLILQEKLSNLHCSKVGFNHFFYFSGRHKILFVYAPSHQDHVDVVTTLASSLKRWLNLDILLDVWDIPTSTSKDPYKWINISFRKATHIVFFGSPDVTVPSSHIYHHIYDSALNLTKIELAKENCSKHFFLVKFPYSKAKCTNDLLINIAQSYKLPRQFRKFLRQLLNKKLYEIVKYDPKYKLIKKELRNVIIEATLKIMNCNVQNTSLVDFKYKQDIVPLQQELYIEYDSVSDSDSDNEPFNVHSENI